ncbi:MAG TPA: hypothetical protein VEY92_06345 [Pseudoxanthomonas sp.]|nr:hypothetical protein [Pseudoxanthomonas sp.]
MNTKSFLPLTAAALFAVCAGSALISSHNADAASAPAIVSRIIDLPTVTVRPDPADLAAYHASRIVELPAVTVRPETQDLAFYLARHTTRTVDLPTVTVRPSAEDMERVVVAGAALAQRLSARSAP